METVDINENNVNDKTDRSGKGLSCIDTTIEIILGERSLQVPEKVIFWKIVKWGVFNPKNDIEDFLVYFWCFRKNRSRLIWKFSKQSSSRYMEASLTSVILPGWWSGSHSHSQILFMRRPFPFPA